MKELSILLDYDDIAVQHLNLESFAKIIKNRITRGVVTLKHRCQKLSCNSDTIIFGALPFFKAPFLL